MMQFNLFDAHKKRHVIFGSVNVSLDHSTPHTHVFRHGVSKKRKCLGIDMLDLNVK